MRQSAGSRFLAIRQPRGAGDQRSSMCAQSRSGWRPQRPHEPWQRLNFLPLPQRHFSFRGTAAFSAAVNSALWPKGSSATKFGRSRCRVSRSSNAICRVVAMTTPGIPDHVPPDPVLIGIDSPELSRRNASGIARAIWAPPSLLATARVTDLRVTGSPVVSVKNELSHQLVNDVGGLVRSGLVGTNTGAYVHAPDPGGPSFACISTRPACAVMVVEYRPPPRCFRACCESTCRCNEVPS